jgi:hypothetical protein
MSTDYERHDALALAALIRTRAVSPRELLDAALARLDACNAKLGAVCAGGLEDGLAPEDGALEVLRATEAAGILRGQLAQLFVGRAGGKRGGVDRAEHFLISGGVLSGRSGIEQGGGTERGEGEAGREAHRGKIAGALRLASGELAGTKQPRPSRASTPACAKAAAR